MVLKYNCLIFAPELRLCFTFLENTLKGNQVKDFRLKNADFRLLQI